MHADLGRTLGPVTMNADRDRVLVKLLAAENVAQTLKKGIAAAAAATAAVAAAATAIVQWPGPAPATRHSYPPGPSGQPRLTARLTAEAGGLAPRVAPRSGGGAGPPQPGLRGRGSGRGIVVIHRSDCQLPLARVRILQHTFGLAAPPLPPLPLQQHQHQQQHQQLQQQQQQQHLQHQLLQQLQQQHQQHQQQMAAAKAGIQAMRAAATATNTQIQASFAVHAQHMAAPVMGTTATATNAHYMAVLGGSAPGWPPHPPGMPASMGGPRYPPYPPPNMPPGMPPPRPGVPAAPPPPTAEAPREVLRELRRLRRDGNLAPAAETAIWVPDEADVFVWRARVRPAAGSALAIDLALLSPPLTAGVRSGVTEDGGDGGGGGGGGLGGGESGEQGTVLLELRFPPDFPTRPPFVRVLAPRFVIHTGHVTVISDHLTLTHTIT